MRELNHRIKNLFAVTGGMIALALAHDLILPGAGDEDETAQPTGLDALLRKILSPYVETDADGGNSRLVIEGPPVPLGARAVTTFALILHELATNAAKYGALSVAQGRLHIAWSCAANVLVMKWAESGGPAVAGTPQTKGFGTLLSDHSVRTQFGGSLSHDWNRSGLVVSLSVPLERLQR